MTDHEEEAPFWQRRSPPKPGPILVTSAVLCAVQFLFLSISFPISELLTTKPLIYIDSAFHWYHIKFLKELADQGLLFGYDPYLGAGGVRGVLQDASGKFQALAGLAMGSAFEPNVAYKVSVFLTGLLGPLCFVLAAYWLRLAVSTTVIATCIALTLWWASGIHGFYTNGMAGYVLCVFIAIPFSVLVVKCATARFDLPRALAAGLLGSFGFFLNPLFLVATILVCGPSLLIHFRFTKPWALIGSFGLICAIVLIVNSFWVWPLLQQGGPGSGSALPDQKVISAQFLWRPMLGIGFGTKLNVILLVLSIWALQAANAKDARILVLGALLASVVSLLYAAFGAGVPMLAITQPNRYNILSYLVLTIPAAIGVSSVIDKIRARELSIPVIGMAILIACGTAYAIRDVSDELSSEPHGHYGKVPPLVTGEGPVVKMLLSELKQLSTPDSRILFENSGKGVYDVAHVSGYLARRLDRELLTSAYPGRSKVTVTDGWVLGKPITEYEGTELADLLRLYNVGLAVVHSESVKSYFGSAAGVELLLDTNDIQIYRIANPPGYVVEGVGKVSRRGVNEVEVGGVDSSSLTLRYHYAKCLRASPASIQVEQALLDPNRRPFVRLTQIPEGTKVIRFGC